MRTADVVDTAPPAEHEAAPLIATRWREVLRTVENHEMPIGGLRDRSLATVRQCGTATADNGEVATLDVWLTRERNNEDVSYHGYSRYSYADGSTQVMEFSGRGVAFGRHYGVGTFIEGTGRFAGIAGSASFKALDNAGEGATRVDVRASYRFPPAY